MNYLKFLIYFLFSKIILLSIYVSRLKKINLLYTSHFGFGDYLFFCVEIREKLDSKTKIFCFSKLQELVSERTGYKIGTYYHFAHNLHLYYDQLPERNPLTNRAREYAW